MLERSSAGDRGHHGVPTYDVLVVEDDEAIREGLATLLESEGFSVASAGDGEEALDRLVHAQIGVVLLDLMLPVMSGWELASAMRQDPHLASVPILTITAVGNAHHAPPGPVFLKPLNTESLLRGVAQCLGQAAIAPELSLSLAVHGHRRAGSPM